MERLEFVVFSLISFPEFCSVSVPVSTRNVLVALGLGTRVSSSNSISWFYCVPKTVLYPRAHCQGRSYSLYLPASKTYHISLFRFSEELIIRKRETLFATNFKFQ